MRDWLNAKIAPMLAETSPPFDSDRFLFEIKWDGIRALAFFGPSTARVQGRKLADTSLRYPEIVRALKKLPGEGVLDGEIVVLDAEGRPNFQRVLIREQTRSADQAALKAPDHPAVYMAFDLLYRDGEALVDRPLLERRERLTELLQDAPAPIVESTYVKGRGKALYREADARGLEGIVGKRGESRYLIGARSNEWRKVKVRRRVDCVLLALLREAGTARVRSLVLGAYQDGELVWMGNVGSGLDGETLSQLGTQLGALRAERPKDFHAEGAGTLEWLKPALVVRVEYSELTNERRLRHPVFIGFVQKEPSLCHPPER